MSGSPSRARRSTPTPKVDALAFRLHNDPTFVQAVNRAANLKCLAAIKSGRLRVVQAQGTVSAPLRYSPRYVIFVARFLSNYLIRSYSMDIVDDPSLSRVVAMFELPGIRSSDITLQIREGNLVITGTRTMPSAEALRQECSTADDKEIKPEDNDVDMKSESPSIARLNAPVQELRYGSFYRAIRIPEGIQVRK